MYGIAIIDITEQAPSPRKGEGMYGIAIIDITERAPSPWKGEGWGEGKLRAEVGATHRFVG